MKKVLSTTIYLLTILIFSNLSYADDAGKNEKDKTIIKDPIKVKQDKSVEYKITTTETETVPSDYAIEHTQKKIQDCDAIINNYNTQITVLQSKIAEKQAEKAELEDVLQKLTK